MEWVDLFHKLLFQLMLTHTGGYHVVDDVQAMKSTCKTSSYTLYGKHIATLLNDNIIYSSLLLLTLGIVVLLISYSTLSNTYITFSVCYFT